VPYPWLLSIIYPSRSGAEVPGDRLTRRKLPAALVSYSGIVVIFIQGLAISTDLLFGDLLILASALVLEDSVYSARAAGRIHIAGLVLARVALSTEPSRYATDLLTIRSCAMEPVPSALRRTWIACSMAAVVACVWRTGFSIMKSWRMAL
jgi:drug/metabolite transporter (DMT)-like permease